MTTLVLDDSPDREALALAVSRAVRESAEAAPNLRVIRVSLQYADGSGNVLRFPASDICWRSGHPVATPSGTPTEVGTETPYPPAPFQPTVA